MKYFITLFLSVSILNAAPFWELDAEIKVLGMVCPSCAIGVKKAFQRHRSVVGVKMDTKKQLLFLDFGKTKEGKTTWVANPEIIRLVEKAGYEVASIKLFRNDKPNRYNKP